VDEKGRTICFHLPKGLQATYGEKAVRKFATDIDFYSLEKSAMLPDELRHPFHD